MKIETKTFLKKIGVLSAILCILGLTVIHSLLPHVDKLTFLLQLFLVSLGTLISHIQLIKALKHSLIRFNSIFMAVSIIRMLAYAIFITLYLIFIKVNHIEFVSAFMIIYFSFLFLDVAEFMKLSDKQYKPIKKVEAKRR